MRFFLTSLLLFCLSFTALAEQAPTFETQSFLDASGTVAFEDVRSLSEESWAPQPDQSFSIKFLEPEYYSASEEAVLWLRLTFDDTNFQDRFFIQLLPNTGHDGEIALYVDADADTDGESDGVWHWYQAVGRPGSELEDTPSRYMSFAINPQRHGKVAYLKLTTQQIFNFDIQAKSDQELISEKVFNTLFFGVLAGALLLALVYNGVIGSRAKEKVYVFYAIYVFFVIIYITAVAGFVRVIFPTWTGTPTLSNLSVLTVMGSAIFFVRELLETKRILPKLDRLFEFVLVALVFGVLAILFGSHRTGYFVSEIFGLSVPILVFLLAVLAVRVGHPLAKYFLAAWVLIITIAAYWSWMWLGLIQPSQGLVNLLLAGIAAEVLLLAMVLGLKFSRLKEQTERLTRDKNKLKFLSEVDELTGLLNRRGFLKRVNYLVKAQKDFVWLAMDIDHFKQFNDEHGHLAGDQLLSSLGKLLVSEGHLSNTTLNTLESENNALPEGSIVGRIGGEEFGILLVGCSLVQAHEIIEDTRTAFAELRITKDNGEQVGTTISIGGTRYQAGESYLRTWKRADKLLYEAKNAGRNRVLFD